MIAESGLGEHKRPVFDSDRRPLALDATQGNREKPCHFDPIYQLQQWFPLIYCASFGINLLSAFMFFVGVSQSSSVMVKRCCCLWLLP
jgi:hypothetical protein